MLKKPTKRSLNKRVSQCPSCGAELVLGSVARNRVQCPKCRQTIELAAQPADGEGSDAGDADHEACRAQITELSARVAALESEVARLIATNATATPPSTGDGKTSLDSVRAETVEVPEPSPFARMLSGSANGTDGRGAVAAVRPDGVQPKPQDVTDYREQLLLRTLKSAGSGAINVCVTESDYSAQMFARRVASIFVRAGWSVRGIEVKPLPPELHALTLATSGERLTAGAAAIHHAFAEAGYTLVYQIDPELPGADPVLIIPFDASAEIVAESLEMQSAVAAEESAVEI